MRRRWLTVTTVALLVAGAAGAVGKGGSLFIKTKDAKLLEKADPKAKVLGTMKPGEEVKWEGADPGNKMFHKVIISNGKTGYTLQQNLSPSKPQMEVASDDGKPIDAQAFASSGAATKALSEAALKYNEKKGTADLLTLSKGVITAEGIAAAVAKSGGGAR
ncbi:MAG: SH3 domain-containing protein [Myxococcota bacterium]